MKLSGNLKEIINKEENTEQARDLTEEAGVKLSDDTLEKVSGGSGGFYYDEEYVRR